MRLDLQKEDNEMSVKIGDDSFQKRRDSKKPGLYPLYNSE